MQYYFENMAISLLPVSTRNKNVDTVRDESGPERPNSRNAKYQKDPIPKRPKKLSFYMYIYQIII